MIHRNMKAHDYIVIVKDIEKGYATFSQWDQLSTNMVFALPWRLLQQCPDGLILDKPETVEKLAEKEEALSDWDDDNRGVRWDENSGWTFKSLEKPDAPSTEEDTSEDFTPQPSLADSVEEEVLDERFDSRAGKYDMTGIKLLEEEPGQIVVRGPRSIAQEEY
ncbi:uncharacterized protein J4E87_005950 [Alternaria ethzedia]|uniref:uncharacterized protein n=1 Tax=Alternaria ethzedia TaxID=181014 RepID=UPI0020C40443|nr:uncharacterized protein J4E87_005950 [Alternaria ethzedia]KAI4622857.1 hypothetical protein J4E87_005950 [Alternaria ethzedia]